MCLCVLWRGSREGKRYRYEEILKAASNRLTQYLLRGAVMTKHSKKVKLDRAQCAISPVTSISRSFPYPVSFVFFFVFTYLW